MAARSDQYAANAERTPATITPTAGLGAALARLPPPWTVFRHGGISPFDTGGGEIYGGLYIALHPERGIALVDVEPAQPAKALPRLGALLRETGLPEFAGAAPPAIAMVLARADIPLASLRLGKAFEAAPFIKSPTWTKVVAAALMARFPDLKQVQRAGGTASASELADDGTEAAASVAAAASAEAPRTPAFVAAAPAAVTPAQPARAPAPRLTAGDPVSTGGATPPRYTRPSMDSLETEPGEWRDRLPRGRLIQGVVIVAAVLAAAALFLLPMRHTVQPGVESRTPEPAPASAQVAPPPAVPPAATGQAATITPPASTSLPSTALPAVAPPPLPPPVGQAAGGTPAAAPSGSAAPAAPSMQAPLVTPPPPAPAQTAIVAPPPTQPVVVPPSVPSSKAPLPLGKAPQPTAIPAKKPPKAETPQTATKEERPRKREADLPAASPEETVTVDGVTYIKGREPHTLGAAAVPAESGDGPNPAPPQAAAPPPPPDHTPGGITLSPSGSMPVQVPAGTVQDSPQ